MDKIIKVCLPVIAVSLLAIALEPFVLPKRADASVTNAPHHQYRLDFVNGDSDYYPKCVYDDKAVRTLNDAAGEGWRMVAMTSELSEGYKCVTYAMLEER